MKSFLLSLLGICVVGVTVAYVTYRMIGPPDRSVPCDPEALPEHYVCLATVREWDDDEILWVDARPEKDWENDGVEGSILINDQKEWLDQEFGFMSRMSADPKPKVVVYCNQSGCGSSKYVANQLRERHAGTFGFEVFVLEGGASALQAERESK